MNLISQFLILLYFLLVVSEILPNATDNILIFLRSSQENCIVSSGPKGFSLRKSSPFETDAENNGLLIAVLHQVHGQHMIEPHHFQIWSDFRWLQSFMDKIQPGRIILLALRGELYYSIPKNIRDYLALQGSFGASLVGRHVRWSWAFIKGGKTIMELISFGSVGSRLVPSIEGTRQLRLSNIKEHCALWPNTAHWRERRVFCNQYELYGDLCSCSQPHRSFRPAFTNIEHNQMDSAFTSIISHRPSLLYESLKTLLPNPGLNKTRLRVFTQRTNHEMSQLLRLLRLPLISSGLTSDGSVNTILRQYIFVFNYVLEHFGESKFYVFLEDDLRYSPDFYIFLNRTTQLLLEDPTLYCVSAHNDLSYPHTSLNPHTVWRAESYPNCGWMVKREFVQKLLSLEKFSQENADWDIMAYNYLREARECIIPEVSRSQHFGRDGAHVNSYKARIFFSSKNYNTDPNALVQNVHLIKHEIYEETLKGILQRSVPLNVIFAPPCSPNFYNSLENSSSDVIVIYFSMETLHHFATNEEYTILAECLDIFSNSARESHFGLYRMRWREKHLLLIGYPASRYSSYKPNEAPVFKSNRLILSEARTRAFRRLPFAPSRIQNFSTLLKDFWH